MLIKIILIKYIVKFNKIIKLFRKMNIFYNFQLLFKILEKDMHNNSIKIYCT